MLTSLLAASVILGGNALAVIVSSFSGNWAIFNTGWAFEIFLLVCLLAIFMRSLRNVWFLIPIGYFYVSGWALGLVSLFDAWNIWPGMVAVIVLGLFASLIATFWLVERDALAQRLLPIMGLATAFLSAASAFLFMVASFFFG
ncbi:MAG: hypothetical protein AAF614_30115 [Chloroflexota bacterium]